MGKLKQIMGSQEYFGGLNVIATGAFHQLPPVGDQWIFNQTRIRGRCNATATNIWKVYFKMYKLTEHVRSEGDQEYSLLQEQIAIGKVSQDMYEKLNERVQAICDTEHNNDWYKYGKQIMITPPIESFHQCITGDRRTSFRSAPASTCCGRNCT